MPHDALCMKPTANHVLYGEETGHRPSLVGSDPQVRVQQYTAVQQYKGGGISSCGDYFGGENFATLANPKAHTASRTHCTAKGP